MSTETTSVDAPLAVEDLDSADILAVLKARFQHERISQHFNLASDYDFVGSRLRVHSDNSLFLTFSVKEAGPLGAREARVIYRLLVLLGARDEQEYSDDLRLDLSELADKFNIDRTIVWSSNMIPATVTRLLKRQNVEIICLTQTERRKQNALPFFLPLPQKTHEYDVTVNAIADLLTRRLKKLFHLVLSEVAAPIYDSLYGKDKVATLEMMRWEEDEVARIAQHLKSSGRSGLAVDVGCGTGRHTFPLADAFKEVFAFDFSPKMIKQTKSEKKRLDNRNISFEVIDIEYEDVPPEHVLTATGDGRVDLVLASFGMGSFVEDTAQLLRRFHKWLRPGGYVILSFYNADALLLNVKPTWRDTSLAAHLDVETKTLRVELGDETVFHIFCQPYSEAIRAKVNAIFEVERISSFPSIMALMPNGLLTNDLAAALFSHVDRVLAAEWELQRLVSEVARCVGSDDYALKLLSRIEEILISKGMETPKQLGYYVMVVARKGGSEGEGFARVMALLKRNECDHSVISHAPVQSVSDVVNEIGEFRGQMVKTVIFKHRPSKRLYAVVLFAERRVDKKAIAEQLGLKPGSFVYASEKDVLRLGFPLGGLAPFGFDPSSNIVGLVDEEILETESEWLYSRIGDNSKTLKIRASDFKRMVEYRKIRIQSTRNAEKYSTPQKLDR